MASFVDVKTARSEFVGFPDSIVLGDKFTGAARLWDFDLNKARLKPEHLFALYHVADYLRRNPGYFCRIIGLASRSGNQGHNRQLSRQRAGNVHGALVVHYGVPSGQLLSGVPVLALGEDAWAAKKHIDGGKKGYVERGIHRLVVLTLWTDNKPDPDAEANYLSQILDGRPILLLRSKAG
jgi:hypothetical protein